MTPKMNRFLYPVGAKMSFFGIEQDYQNRYPKVTQIVPKMIPRGTSLASKIDPGRVSETTCIKTGSGDVFFIEFLSILELCGYLYGVFFGTCSSNCD